MQVVGQYMLNHDRWLGVRNRYRGDVVSRLDAEVRSGKPLNAKHLAEYIAASVPLHVADGWGYLGRAVHCHASGNPDIARHLAYYAELRAAMALLASHGIGIFNRRHFVVDSSGNITCLQGRGTHEAAWLFLEEWAARPVGAAAVATVIRPHGHQLDAWVAELAGQPTWQPVGTEWLLKLGLDLKRLGLDREARNSASYRPTQLATAAPMDALTAARFVVDFVEYLEPSAPFSFGKLDLHLLRLTLEMAFRAVTGRTSRQAPAKFMSSVESATAVLIDDPARREDLVEFLTRRRQSQDAALIARASTQEPPTTTEHHTQVMCRAALLLRISTGVAAKLLNSSGVPIESLSAWWTSLGLARGLWRVTPDAGELGDAWEDIAVGLADIDEWVAHVSDPTYRDLLDDCAEPLNRVSALEVLAVAGVGA